MERKGFSTARISCMAIVPDQPRLLPWGTSATIAWLLLALIASAVAAVGVCVAWVGELPREFANSYDGKLVSISTLASVPIGLSVLALAAKMRGWSLGSYFALRLPRRRELVTDFLCVIVFILASNIFLAITANDIVTPFQISIYHSAAGAGWLFSLFLAVVVFAPFGEEIFFRGFFYRGVARPGREFYALVITALVWSLLHIQYDAIGIGQVFMFGLLLGWFRWVRNSTTIPILMHMFVNLEGMIETVIKVQLLA
jgi:membrane protease YdiL (CAAX protease family)